MDYQDCLTAAREKLLQAQHLVIAEMRAYPTPISGCDAQYTHLVVQRSAIRNALAALSASPFVATPRVLSPGDRVESR